MNELLQEYLNNDVRIIASNDDGIVAFEKPCDVLSHPNATSSERAILSAPYDFKQQSYKFPNGNNVFLLNRLDSPVSGIIIGCTNENTANSVRTAFRSNNVQKEYVALVKGYTHFSHGTWRSTLQKQHIGNKLVVRSGTGNLSITQYNVIKSRRVQSTTISLLNLHPITGRTHQLRVHCAMNRLPIIGDDTYGDRAYNKIFRTSFHENRLFLHAQSITIKYSINNQQYIFCVHSPCQWRNIISTIFS